ncbi:MAG: lipoyl synthase [Syntrophobacteraceae bacterium]|nr:lipoyl synthase [Syntrophobacteraceae bacterium]
MKTPKPPWLRVKPPSGEATRQVRQLVRGKGLNTVCEEARCPNLAECWGNGTATFLILGDVCTRECGFCAVRTMREPGSLAESQGLPHGPAFPDSPQTLWHDREVSEEAQRVAEAVLAMGLKHAVITSVTRDDLPDGGASVFAGVIQRIGILAPGCAVEVLVPDFLGKAASIGMVLGAGPRIFGHNVETVPRLYPLVRPHALYRRSLSVLEKAKAMSLCTATKSGFMVGLGESRDELVEVMEDLRAVGCDILTIGQYLSPGADRLPVVRYYDPEEFQVLKETALKLGFGVVESGPLVRSSYHAEDQASALGRKQHDQAT